ncbi:MAG: HAD family acid phosphatase [Silvanigrellaceae bacterium]|nr:HAD family acid phosphatase [Silvanigrellaceae bacterium]
MQENEFLKNLKNKFDKLSVALNQQEKKVLDEAYDAAKHLFLDFFHTITIPGLPHPHPRSRIYRSEPMSWKIKDISSQKLYEFILKELKKRNGKNPICIFDLDGTLFDVGYRTLGIIQDWLISDEAKRFNQNLILKISKINYNHIGYGLVHAFENAGFNLRDEETMDIYLSIEKLWRKKFFDGESLIRFDSLIPGASEFVNACLNEKIKIVYLTGRAEKHMQIGTKSQLSKFSFPLDNCEIYMMLDTFMDDHLYKSQVIRDLMQEHTIIANFENEYINLAHMALEAPEALHVIVDSQHSGRQVPQLDIPIYRIKSFEIK